MSHLWLPLAWLVEQIPCSWVARSSEKQLLTPFILPSVPPHRAVAATRCEGHGDLSDCGLLIHHAITAGDEHHSSCTRAWWCPALWKGRVVGIPQHAVHNCIRPHHRQFAVAIAACTAQHSTADKLRVTSSASMQTNMWRLLCCSWVGAAQSCRAARYPGLLLLQRRTPSSCRVASTSPAPHPVWPRQLAGPPLL